MSKALATLDGVEFQSETLDLPAAGKGHDVWSIDDGFVGIADGSTPLVPNLEIDARAYAHDALQRLARHRSDEPAEMFRHALSEADPPQSPPSRSASCTVATLSVTGEDLAASVLGDCIALLRTAAGHIGLAYDRRLDRFDRPVAERIARDIAHGMPLEQAQAAANLQLIANRDRANTDSAYWIFADDPTAAPHIETTSASLGEIELAFLCSDGFARLIDPFHVADDAPHLLELADTKGLAALGRCLRDLEQAPGSLTDHPRLDRSDDATAILLRRIP